MELSKRQAQKNINSKEGQKSADRPSTLTKAVSMPVIPHDDKGLKHKLDEDQQMKEAG